MKNSYKSAIVLGGVMFSFVTSAALPGVDCVWQTKKNGDELQCFSGQYFYPQWLLALEAGKREVAQIAKEVTSKTLNETQKNALRKKFATAHARYKDAETKFFAHKDTYSKYYNGSAGEDKFISEALKIQQEFHHFTSQIQERILDSNAPQTFTLASNEPKRTAVFDRYGTNRSTSIYTTQRSTSSYGFVQPTRSSYSAYTASNASSQDTLRASLAAIMARHQAGEITDKGFVVEVQKLLQ